MSFVQITTPNGQTFRREIPSDILRIGRSRNNDLVLEDQSVSRNHAEIVRHPEGFYLVDVGSKTGIYLNGRRLDEPALLKNSDSIRLGNTTISFEEEASSVVFQENPAPDEVEFLVLAAPEISPAYPTAALRATVDVTEGMRERLGVVTARGTDPEALPFERGVLMLRQGSGWIQAAVRTAEGAAHEPITLSRTLTERVVGKRESILTTDAKADERFREGMSVLSQGIRSALCVPLWNNREVIGLLYVDSRKDANLFNRESLHMLTHLANMAAVKIENCRLFERTLEAQTLEREVRRAAEIQKYLLPSDPPQFPAYEMAGESRPCHAVGGDTYDYLALADGRTMFAIGDVSGKGLSASLLMCWFQAGLLSLSELGLGVLEVIRHLNRALSRRFPEDRFVTLFYGVLDPSKNTLTYVNGGHCPPLLCLPAGDPQPLAHTGPPLGLFEESVYEEASVAFGPGATLLCYTDGIPGVRGASGDFFGKERLSEQSRGLAGMDAAEGVQRILAEVERFGAGRPFEDDCTVLLVRRKG
jgi:serine phosphatase RsbU (regulator of sigma subunit)